MDGQPIVLFPDTNFFLECREPAECPWSEITDAEEITLAVCRSVRSEIDQHKTGKGRVTDRARKWTSRLREASRNGGRITLREAKPKLVVWVPPPVPPLSPLPSVLDPNRPDDRVIADILAQKATAPTLVDAKFFTDDGGAADTARYTGLSTIDVPLDDGDRLTWRLPIEPDGNEKRIRALEEQIRSLEKQAPSIAIQVNDDDGNEIQDLPMEIVRFPPLTPREIEQLAAQAETASPLQTNFRKEPPSSPRLDPNDPFSYLAIAGITMRGLWRPPDDAAIKKYTETDYPEWQKAIREFFGDLHTKLETTNRVLLISIALSNNGTVPAENATVTFEALGGLFLASIPDPESEKAGVDFTRPAAPIPPTGGYLTSALGNSFTQRHFDPMSALAAGIRPKTRERTRFYWRDRDDSTRWKADCAELRHKVGPERFKFMICVRGDISEVKNAAIRCTVSASNLPEPVQKIVKVPITFTDGDTGAYAITLLHRKEPWRVMLGDRMPARP